MHATLIVAPTFALELLPAYARTPGADVSHLDTPELGIDDARRLIAEASRRGVCGTRTFVIRAESLTREAQNALLKLFEEPPEGVSFLLIVPHESMLIGTLRSRFQGGAVVAGDTRENADVDTFIHGTHAERLAMVADLAKEKGGARLRAMGEGIAAAVAARPDAYDAATLRAVGLVAAHLRTKGGSRKMLLEHLALALPAGGGA